MKLALTIAALTLLACSSQPVNPPLPPPDTDLCADMCAHLARLKCEEGQPVYNNDLPGPVDVPNQSCADNCTELQDKGVFVNTKCVLQVTACDQIEDVRVKDPKTCATP